MNTTAKFRTLAISHIGAILIGATSAALAADNLDIGKSEYEVACAVCHGRTGRGDGPLKLQMVSQMPDLTVLAKNNYGVFPFDRVYQIIDGRREVLAHGPRDMPVWGRNFNMQSSIYFENYPRHDIESNARSRMLALTEYLYRLQAK